MKTFERRFLFVTGKGGVGKTTVSACLARALSSRGRRVLLAATDPAGYGDLLPNALWLDDPQPCGERLFTVQLEPEAALREYGRLLIKPRLARQAVFENRFVQGFLKGLPGLPQWAVLGKAWYHTTEMEEGVPRFDSVVFDAPATGHAVELLRLPRVIAELAPAGLLRRDAELAWELLSDPGRTCIALVTLPEELPSNETSELATRIANELGLPLGAVLMNRLRPLLFQPDERNALTGLEAFDPAAPGGAALEAARLRAIAESVQLDSETRLAEVRAPLFQLPELDSANGQELLGGLLRVLQQT
ncbi:MAG TPA: ArsA family ATPase [Polyangiaceae bacterium]|nr:ArsA family ATPase [Polyangiaceae bacterium]